MKLLILAIVLGLTAPALAGNKNANLNRGNVEAGGSTSLAYSSFSKFNFNFVPNLQYFVEDNLSLGGELYAAFNALTSGVAIGPKATFYFWSSEKWAANSALSVLLSRSNNTINGDFANSLDIIPSSALLYFVIPSVGVGPTLHFDIPVGRTTYDGSTMMTTTLSAHLSVFF